MLLTRLPKKKQDSDSHVAPLEFLEWAKVDLESNEKRSIGNGLGNIKKAIHSRIDEIIDNTHIKYCAGWSQYVNTKAKLQALEFLDIKYTAVVSLLTDIRNTFEHRYRLPNYGQAIAYLETAEMWISLSYEKHSFNKLGIIGLKTKGFGVSGSFEKTKLLPYEIENNCEIEYFWESRKEVHTIKNGKLTITSMADSDWKSMAQFESKHIRYSGTPNATEFVLSGRLLTSIYKRALKKLVK